MSARVAAILVASALVLAGPRAAAQSHPSAASAHPSIKRAIAYYNAGDDARADKELAALLAGSVTQADAAKAHLYLGLVRLNALDSARARAEFQTALTIDPALELPFEAPPKAEILFSQARAALNPSPSSPVAGSAPAPTPSAASPGPTPPAAPVLVVTPEEPPGPSHLLSLTVGGVGVAAALAGGVCLVLSATTLASARGANTFAHDAQSEALTSADEQYAAEWLLSSGGALVGAGVVIFFVERALGASPQQAVSKAASALVTGMRF